MPHFRRNRGLAVGVDYIKSIMSQIASDEQPLWKTGVSTDDTIRAFGARHREQTYRNSKYKDKSKLRGERYVHVEEFFNILRDIERILSDGDRIWNGDETNATYEFGKRIKVFELLKNSP